MGTAIQKVVLSMGLLMLCSFSSWSHAQNMESVWSWSTFGGSETGWRRPLLCSELYKTLARPEYDRLIFPIHRIFRNGLSSVQRPVF